MPGIAAVGGTLAGQLGASAVSSGGGSIFLGIQQGGNYLVQNGIITYDAGVLLAHMGVISTHQFDQHRRWTGMEGDSVPAGNLHVSQWQPDFQQAWMIPGVLQQELHINDRARQIFAYAPTVQETIFLLNRRLISEQLAEHYLNVATAGEDGVAKAFKQSRFEIPGPSDLIRFAVRDAFSPQIVQTFGYHKELPIHILPFMEMQGYGGQLGIDIPAGATTTVGAEQRTKAQWFDLYWWSHWELVSPTQGYLMLHRLYADSRWGPSPDWTPETQFHSEDLSLLLKAQDYPDYWRKRLEAISYSPLTRVDVRRMYDMGVLEEKQVYHAYRAIGYNDNNAHLLTEWTKALKEAKLFKKFKYISAKDIETEFNLGLINEDQAKIQLRAIGLDQENANLSIMGFKIREAIRRIKLAVGVAKKGFFNGIFDNDQVRAALTNSGMSLQKANEYLGDWTRERVVNKRFLSAQNLVEMASKGIINEQEFRRRLQNLNYSVHEIEDMVNRVKLTIQQQYQRIIEKLAGEFAKQQSKLEQLQQRQLNALLKPYSDANIKKWYKSGRLPLNDVIAIRKLQQWGNGAIEDWIAEELNEQVEISDELELENEEQIEEIVE